ncbi:MAG: thioredoxin family protein [Flavobacteriaceae bacterium]
MIKNITSHNFADKVLKSKKPILLEIYTKSCPNCKVLAPVVEETAKANSTDFSFYKLNAKDNLDLVKQFKVMGVPTLLFFSHGILVDKKAGVINQIKIEKRLKPLLDYTKENAAKKQITGFFKLPWK